MTDWPALRRADARVGRGDRRPQAVTARDAAIYAASRDGHSTYRIASELCKGRSPSIRTAQRVQQIIAGMRPAPTLAELYDTARAGGLTDAGALLRLASSHATTVACIRERLETEA